jgi:lipopolysaccharide export system permease protein
MQIIRRYLSQEIMVPFLLTLTVLIFVLLLGNMYKMAEMVIAKGVRLTDVLSLILSMVPYLLTMAIPMAFFFSLMVGLGRMGSDGEITAMKALGISPRDFLPPVMLIAVVCTCIVLVLEIWLVPRGLKKIQSITLDILKNKTVLALRPHALSLGIKGLGIYVDEIDRETGMLKGVVIFDQREGKRQHTITAREGLIIPDQDEGNLFFLLRQGTIHGYETGKDSYQLTDFNEYKINLDLDALLGQGTKKKRARTRSLNLGELRQKIQALENQGKDASKVRNSLYKRISMSFSCLVFALIGIPLALEPARTSGRFRGLVFALFLLLVYYILFSFGQAIGEKGGPLQLPALWLANVVFAALGGFLFWKKQQEIELAGVKRINLLVRRLAAFMRMG